MRCIVSQDMPSQSHMAAPGCSMRRWAGTSKYSQSQPSRPVHGVQCVAENSLETGVCVEQGCLPCLMS